VDAVVPVLEDEVVVKALGREITLLLRDPFLEPAVRHDPERHRYLLNRGVARSK
jgi:hypothetical protein